MKYLHTMFRVTNLEKSLRFYCDGLGFQIVSQNQYPEGRFTLAFVQSHPGDPVLELTYNWDTDSYDRGSAFGHVAYRVDSIDSIQERLIKHGYNLSWGPGTTPNGKGKMAFVDDPDGYEIELLE
jgi:lactoylglutathione lyase